MLLKSRGRQQPLGGSCVTYTQKYTDWENKMLTTYTSDTTYSRSKIILHRGVDKRNKIGYNILITSTLDVIHIYKKEIRC